jgi:hypothetical protein
MKVQDFEVPAVKRRRRKVVLCALFALFALFILHSLPSCVALPVPSNVEGAKKDGEVGCGYCVPSSALTFEKSMI